MLSQSLCLYFPPSPASALAQTPAIHQQQSHFCLESRLLLSALDPPFLPDSFLPMTHRPLKPHMGTLLSCRSQKPTVESVAGPSSPHIQSIYKSRTNLESDPSLYHLASTLIWVTHVPHLDQHHSP